MQFLENSFYKYMGPLIILSKVDLGDETCKDFCLFCGNLQENIKKHMIEDHPNQEQVAFVKSLPNKEQIKFWKFLIVMGNHTHNNMNALHSGTGFIIPSLISSSQKNIHEMRMCSGCRTWVTKGSLYLHKKSCPAEQWEQNFGSFLEERFKNGYKTFFNQNLIKTKLKLYNIIIRTNS